MSPRKSILHQLCCV